MVTIFNNLNLSQLQNLSEKNLSSMLKVGQTLNVNIEKVDGNQVQLRLGNVSLNAVTQDASLTPGKARVTITQTQPQLIVSLHKPAVADNQTASQQQIIQAALRQLLPNQASLSQTITQLTQIANLPAPLQAPLQQLLEQIQKPVQKISGKELKTAIENSGMFLESKLKQPSAKNLQHDLKAQMSQLLQQSQQSSIQNASVKQLSQTLIQAVNRITQNQLQQLEPPWGLNIEIARETGQETVEERLEIQKPSYRSPNRWQVFVNLELPQGKMMAKLTLSGESELFCALWSDSDELEQKMIAEQPRLQKALSELGLESIQLQISPTELKPENSRQKVSLIDIHI